MDGVQLPQSYSHFEEAVYTTSKSPSMKLTLSRWGSLSTKKFQPKCADEDSSTERRS